MLYEKPIFSEVTESELYLCFDYSSFCYPHFWCFDYFANNSVTGILDYYYRINTYQEMIISIFWSIFEIQNGW